MRDHVLADVIELASRALLGRRDQASAFGFGSAKEANDLGGRLTYSRAEPANRLRDTIYDMRPEP